MDINQLKVQLQIINDRIKHADSKLWFISAFYVGILWYWISNIKILKEMLWCYYICTIFFISLIFAVWFILIYLSFTPRLKNIHRDSLFYFWTIAKKDFSSFRDKILLISDSDVKEWILEQIHTNAEIANKKMTYTKYSVYPLILLIIISFMSLFII